MERKYIETVKVSLVNESISLLIWVDKTIVADVVVSSMHAVAL